MLNRRTFLVLGPAGLLAGCAGSGNPVAGLFSIGQSDPRPVDVTQLPAMRVAGWQINVPDSLKVSDANLIKPVADIVWHGDPYGDRRAQVKAILDEGVARVARRMQGNLPVDLVLTLRRFHAVTPKTRYAYFGEHEIVFDLEVRNAGSGEVIVPAYRVDATFRAYTQEQAVEADRRGITQKSRILDQLEQRLFQELTGAPAASIDESPLVVGDESPVQGEQKLPPASSSG